ncbi:MAG TPA: LysM peptidoglycan-binding domain-containing protein [Noviherbaspirillum sp.]|nr:LysM peptidoglycan-binding domain-containing protein [Noviherbaspirillum sp.]
MKRMIFVAMLLPVLLACERKQESASSPSEAGNQGTAQSAQQPATASEPPASPPSQAAGQAPSSEPSASTSAAKKPSGASEKSSGSSGEYTVSAGDTLSGIARDHGVNRADLARWNDIKDPNRIHPGQTLRFSEPNSR